MAAIDYQDAKIEHLMELKLAAEYESRFPEGVFYSFGRWHDHTCCPDCCGCADEYSQFVTLEEYMKGI